jgi:hypothetical protein
MAMEKNAVVGPKNSNKNEKTAGRGCPQCGSALDYSGSIPRCPVHGTAPFERQGGKNGR